MSSTLDHILYKGTMFMSNEELKMTLGMLALKEKFEYRIKKSSKTYVKALCKDIGCKFQLRVIGKQGGSYWTFAKFVKDHSYQSELFNHFPQ